MNEDEERHADEVNIAFQMGAEWERKQSKARIEKLEAALLNIVATFGYGSSGGAYKARYFTCLDIAKAELKHLGLGGTYQPYVKYRDKLQALEGKVE